MQTCKKDNRHRVRHGTAAQAQPEGHPCLQHEAQPVILESSATSGSVPGWDQRMLAQYFARAESHQQSSTLISLFSNGAEQEQKATDSNQSCGGDCHTPECHRHALAPNTSIYLSLLLCEGG